MSSAPERVRCVTTTSVYWEKKRHVVDHCVMDVMSLFFLVDGRGCVAVVAGPRHGGRNPVA